MITVRVPPTDPGRADTVTAALDELVVAYRIEPGADELVVIDGDRHIEATGIPQYLDELRAFVADWRKYQSDACYVEDDGSIC